MIKWKDKSPQEKYKNYQRLNKVEKLKKAKLEGFDDLETFRRHLQNHASVKIVSTTIQEKVITKGGLIEVPDRPIIHNVHILDASGSMASRKLNNALKGINTEIKELKKDNSAEYYQTLVVFGSEVHVKEFKKPIKDIKQLSTETIGLTALYQAIGETLEKCKNSKNNNEKVLIKIFTDGGENDSRGQYANKKVLSRFIKECEKLGFTITFVGTSYDVAIIKDQLEIKDSNTLVHDNTGKGVEEAFCKTIEATKKYSKKVVKGEDVELGFYKDIL